MNPRSKSWRQETSFGRSGLFDSFSFKLTFLARFSCTQMRLIGSFLSYLLNSLKKAFPVMIWNYYSYDIIIFMYIVRKLT